MKKSLLFIKTATMAALAFVGRACSTAIKCVANVGPSPLQFSRQGGFVLLGKAYQGYLTGTIVELNPSTEAALILAGQATDSAGPPTAGAVTTTASQGCVTIAAGASSVVVTNPNVKKQHVIYAVVNQAAADGTLLRVERIVVADGSFTIHGTANATAATLIKWAILLPGGTSTPA